MSLGVGLERGMEETAQGNGGKDIAGILEDSGVCTENTYLPLPPAKAWEEELEITVTTAL